MVRGALRAMTLLSFAPARPAHVDAAYSASSSEV